MHGNTGAARCERQVLGSEVVRFSAFVQARMSSTRLPGKVLREVSGRPMLWYVVERVKRASAVESVVLVTSDRPEDAVLLERAKEWGIGGYAGSLEDVLGRFADAARVFEPEAIVRITGDCPLLDPGVVDRVCESLGDADYCSNVHPRTYPKGLDCEVFPRAALERAQREATTPYEREHVTPYLWEEPGRFAVRNVENDVDLSGERWTVDEPEDFEMLSRLLALIPGREVEAGMEEILSLLRAHPGIAGLNAHLER